MSGKVTFFTDLKGQMQWFFFKNLTLPLWTWFEEMMTEAVFNGFAFGHHQPARPWEIPSARLYLTSIWQLNWRICSITHWCFYPYVCWRLWQQNRSSKDHSLNCTSRLHLPNIPFFTEMCRSQLLHISPPPPPFVC